MEPAKRLKRLPTQFFAQLIQRAEQLKHAGYDVINLGQGNPDQPAPDLVIKKLQQAAENPFYHRYISFKGLPALKQAVAHWYRRHYDVQLDAEKEIAILIGSKIGLQEISLALLNPGDKALVPDPGYPDYWSGIQLAGAEMKKWPLHPQTGYPDPDLLTTHMRLAFLNYPNNPTGKLASKELFDAVITKAMETGTILAHDLAYGDIVFDGKRAQSLLARPGGKAVGIEFTTISKSFNMAGFRLGFAAGHSEVIQYLETLQDHLHCSQYGAIQEAAITALTDSEDFVRTLRSLYQSRRDAFLEALPPSYRPPATEGSIFQWMALPKGFPSSLDFAQGLAEAVHVIVAPGVGFGDGGEGYIRISLTESENRLKEAARRLTAFMDKAR
ncbi:aminotransferase class I/II-fold pyridoxal phosphate-dependent enzyme [Sulfobacillus thermosulfidooxidans]|uniref:aminotransferase class I/II-fold pyridoxal phosphate-dependent enzyme n=1 Tax=Sulfobacillus thermosulfidooxidans TaxID=28034 RepID=UPI00097B958E|nr:aminotransferase class I/II-fold pyridoxal phosphate-dependent enzyme [Sulfobacillus thermosulfidooxidans]OLZ11723.1 LL-diaminopimelate aminotransferase [Sulfobacillus thermosulfidooxidans]OLZ18686.1 LL-diaminopimelate aminotransferase [Sulfobacillus thermosulfidooxidans]OLZ20235.1 LL-diaminopimelate aminotransferase [Sulfobacillus thermosulfidooxidans]